MDRHLGVLPLCTLKHLHAALLQDYDCTEQPAADLPALPSGAGARQRRGHRRRTTTTAAPRAPRTPAVRTKNVVQLRCSL